MPPQFTPAPASGSVPKDEACGWDEERSFTVRTQCEDSFLIRADAGVSAKILPASAFIRFCRPPKLFLSENGVFPKPVKSFFRGFRTFSQSMFSCIYRLLLLYLVNTFFQNHSYTLGARYASEADIPRQSQTQSKSETVSEDYAPSAESLRSSSPKK